MIPTGNMHEISGYRPRSVPKGRRLRLLSFRQCELAHTRIAPIVGILFALPSLERTRDRDARQDNQ